MALSNAAVNRFHDIVLPCLVAAAVRLEPLALVSRPPAVRFFTCGCTERAAGGFRGARWRSCSGAEQRLLPLGPASSSMSGPPASHWRFIAAWLPMRCRSGCTGSGSGRCRDCGDARGRGLITGALTRARQGISPQAAIGRVAEAAHWLVRGSSLNQRRR
jgi:hypothetical protein